MKNNKKLKRIDNVLKGVDVFEYYFIKLLSSKKFFWVVISLFVLQALWIATSFRYPMLFDEMYHFGVIKIFGGQLSPFIFDQPTKYDNFGTLTYGSASIYHYLLSFPFRLISLVNSDEAAQIIFLRILNILMAAFGFWLYAKLFTTLGIKQIFINLSLLFFSLIPIVTFIAATISYDNLLFPLTAWFMLIGVKLLLSNKPKFRECLQYLMVGMVASLVKFTFLPLLFFGVMFIGIVFARSYGKKIFSLLLISFRILPVTTKVILLSSFVVISTLFAYRYVVPIIIYKTPVPACSKILNEDRCLSSNVYKYESDAISTKNNRPVESIQQYALSWIKTIIMQLDTSAAFTANGLEVGKAIPIFATLMAVSIAGATVILIYAWRMLEKNIGWNFLILMSISLIIIVFMFNTSSYYAAHLDINTQTRYLLTIFPVIIVMALVAINNVMRHRRHAKVVTLITVLILCTQGGGVIKPIINANDGWYWGDDRVKSNNLKLKNLIQPLVNE